MAKQQTCQDCGLPVTFDWDGFILPCEECGFDQLEEERSKITPTDSDGMIGDGIL